MVKETEYYEVLGIAVDATESDVKRAYRRLALRYHPDKNPNDDSAAEMFKKIGHAYEILSDEEKRRIYDQHGASGLENGGGGADFDPSDIFSMFFGGGPRPRGEPKPKDLVHELKVPLEDMYNGKIKKVSVVRDRLCGSCGGNGMRNGAQRRACTHCNGSGVQVIMHQLFPGMHQRMETTCSSCRGEGTFVRPSDTCDTCRGRCIVKDKKILEVPIEKGAKPKDVIRFEGEGDEIPGVRLKGDVLMFLEQRPHDRFRRVGNHLIVNHTITLQEALCGFQLPLEQLDQRPLLVTIPPGQVIDPEAAWVVHREGMPVPKTGGTSRGNLVIHFNVEYPSQLGLNQIQNIASAFDVHESNLPLYGQRVTLSNESQRKRRNQRNRNANARRRGAPQSVYEAMNDMDEEAFNQRGHAVQCAHQ